MVVQVIWQEGDLLGLAMDPGKGYRLDRAPEGTLKGTANQAGNASDSSGH